MLLLAAQPGHLWARIANAHAPTEEIDRRVSVRMKREQLLTQPDAPEAVGRAGRGHPAPGPDGPKVMGAQLEHLLRPTELPNVTLQIVPFHVGPHAAVGGGRFIRLPRPILLTPL